MDKIKKNLLKIILIIISSIIILTLIFSLVLYLYFYDMRNPPNKMDDPSLKYYDKILYMKNDESNLKSLFDFEWEKAFIQENANEKSEELNSKLGFDANLSELDVWWGYPCRVVFIYKDKVVFEFRYDDIYLDFAEKEIFLYPDTVIKKRGEKPIILHMK